jgi:hypothetical protein
MARGISNKPQQYILECDRGLPDVEQSIYWITCKTVKSSTETAAEYAKAQINKKGGKQEINVPLWQTADDKTWCKAVSKIENFIVPVDAVEGAYEHFFLKTTNEPSVYKLDEETKDITVVLTTNEADLKFIFWCMNSTDAEEIISAYYNNNELKAGLKKG